MPPVPRIICAPMNPAPPPAIRKLPIFSGGDAAGGWPALAQGAKKRGPTGAGGDVPRVGGLPPGEAQGPDRLR